MYYSQEVSKRIKELAKEKRITISKLLVDCGLNNSTLNQISEERGLASFSLAKIADCLDCSVDYLLCRTQNPDSHKIHSSDVMKLSSEDKQLADIIEIYRKLDNIGKAKLLISADEIRNKK